MPLLKSEIAALSITAPRRDSTCHSTLTWALNLLVCVPRSVHRHSNKQIKTHTQNYWSSWTLVLFMSWRNDKPVLAGLTHQMPLGLASVHYVQKHGKKITAVHCMPHENTVYHLITCCSSCDDTYWCCLWLFSVITYFFALRHIKKQNISYYSYNYSFLLAFSAVGGISEKTWVQMLSLVFSWA